MKEIKTISCHGTSFTEGGGFEWDVKSKTEKLDTFYSELPKTEFNYSWPGQLQKLTNAKVTNYGKSGHGNLKVYRDVHSIFIDTSIKNDTHLFLIELSQLGRTELFINELNDYCVINYDILDDNTIQYNGCGIDYYRDSNEVSAVLHKKKEFLLEFLKTTKNVKTTIDELQKNFDFFISFLEYNNLNYRFVNTPLIFFNVKPDNTKIIKYPSLSNKRVLIDFIEYIDEHNLTLEDITKGLVKDPHFSLEGNKNIANIIYEQLKQNYKL